MDGLFTNLPSTIGGSEWDGRSDFTTGRRHGMRNAGAVASAQRETGLERSSSICEAFCQGLGGSQCIVIPKYVSIAKVML